ncbi:hypothetical protein F5148DRAFT_1183655 [Russula earlei]|uniref:Uncharacterized protein n=1 Tax=Russula earlei TaxID=71964 RepID=A0ACC0UE42_9AGAM|nr:hypothetical protein F5148DRAFT_1183655 [Russula earlei]
MSDELASQLEHSRYGCLLAASCLSCPSLRDADRQSLERSVASTVLIFYDWFLTSGDESDFLWRKKRSNYARILFIFARYPALASTVMDLLPATYKLDEVGTCFRSVAIIFSELIFATRTWAIWERSRPMMVFLVVLSIGAIVTAFAKTPRHGINIVGLAPAMPSTTDSQQCQILADAVSHAWVLPYFSIMVSEAVLLALTLYKVLQYHRGIPKQLRSKLLHVLWVDGVIYFVFMLFLGILNVMLVLDISGFPLRGGASQLQTVFHSILSTRITLHTAKVLKQDIIDSRSNVVHYRVSTRIEFADRSDAAGEAISEGRACDDIELPRRR